MKIIKDITEDKERAFYHQTDTIFKNIKITGIADGESSFKEAKNIQVMDSYFNLRYPFWHNTNLLVDNCELTNLNRAAFWYDNQVVINNSILNGIKALRECENVVLKDSTAVSDEFGWFSNQIYATNFSLESSYAFLKTNNIHLKNFSLKGKYSFQYVKNCLIEDSFLDTKDAFWESENVTVKNSTIKGEYLGWYSKNLTLDHCVIDGIQPLCYAKGLKLIDCVMKNATLAFEYSEVQATILSTIDSVKNPLDNSVIECYKINELIQDEFRHDSNSLVIKETKATS